MNLYTLSAVIVGGLIGATCTVVFEPKYAPIYMPFALMASFVVGICFAELEIRREYPYRKKR